MDVTPSGMLSRNVYVGLPFGAQLYTWQAGAQAQTRGPRHVGTAGQARRASR
jgi:hypothetical protein